MIQFLPRPAPLGRPATVVRLRSDIGNGADLKAGSLQRTDRGLAAGAGPDEHIDLLDAVLLRLASGVLGGELGGRRGRLARTLEADVTDDAQAITLPCGSVIDTIVLLNVLLMWAAPCGTFFFSLRRVV